MYSITLSRIVWIALTRCFVFSCLLQTRFSSLRDSAFNDTCHFSFFFEMETGDLNEVSLSMWFVTQ